MRKREKEDKKNKRERRESALNCKTKEIIKQRSRKAGNEEGKKTVGNDEERKGRQE